MSVSAGSFVRLGASLALAAILGTVPVQGLLEAERSSAVRRAELQLRQEAALKDRPAEMAGEPVAGVNVEAVGVGD